MISEWLKLGLRSRFFFPSPICVFSHSTMNHLQKSSTSQNNCIIPTIDNLLENIKIEIVYIFSNFKEVA
jgi:hypothetical protein